jgi:DNA-binding transcriptional ArsR family regulator
MAMARVLHCLKYVSLDRTFRALADPTRRSIEDVLIIHADSFQQRTPGQATSALRFA